MTDDILLSADSGDPFADIPAATGEELARREEEEARLREEAREALRPAPEPAEAQAPPQPEQTELVGKRQDQPLCGRPGCGHVHAHHKRNGAGECTYSGCNCGSFRPSGRHEHDRPPLVRPEASDPAAKSALIASLELQLEALGIKPGERFVVSAPAKYAPGEVEADSLGGFGSKSEASRKAAIDNYPRSGSQRYRVLAQIVHTGGRIRDQLAVELDMPTQSCTARVTELIEGGWAEETAEHRRTRNGSEAAVVVATEKGRTYIADKELTHAAEV